MHSIWPSNINGPCSMNASSDYQTNAQCHHYWDKLDSCNKQNWKEHWARSMRPACTAQGPYMLLGRVEVHVQDHTVRFSSTFACTLLVLW